MRLEGKNKFVKNLVIKENLEDVSDRDDLYTGSWTPLKDPSFNTTNLSFASNNIIQTLAPHEPPLDDHFSSDPI